MKEKQRAEEQAATGGISRRRFLRGIGLVAAGAAGGGLVRPASAASSPRYRARRETVAVFGGGIAGLTAAHELAERGFDVTVYERRAFGGKARSIDVRGSETGGRRPLPGEHGCRTFFGFYQSLPDTMRRIPFGSNPNGVFDNLVPGPQISFSRAGQRDLVLPIGAYDPRPYTPAQIHELLLALLLELDLPPGAAAHLAHRLVTYFSSCNQRRYAEWEEIAWSDFIGSERYGGDYRKLFAEVFTRFTQASTADSTSAQYGGLLAECLVYNLLGRNSNGPFDRVLNLPTNEAFVDPWLALLGRMGVDLRLGYAIESFEVRDGQIEGATVRGPVAEERVAADWYVCALPVERARKLWSPAILEAAPTLDRMNGLQTGWMNGIQFFLREPTPIVKGHIFFLDSPWKLLAISQAQFWSRDFADTYGDGAARDCISGVINEWQTPGAVYGKPARECSPEEIARDVWEQMKLHLNDSGCEPLTDDLLHSWFLDPGLIRREGRFENEDPLVLPSVGAWPNRPESGTAIPNLILAGDYVRGEAEVANMEAANDGGRRAANAILDRSGSRESPCRLSLRYRPPEWEILKQIDEVRFRAGLPNLFDSAVGNLSQLLHL